MIQIHFFNEGFLFHVLIWVRIAPHPGKIATTLRSSVQNLNPPLNSYDIPSLISQSNGCLVCKVKKSDKLLQRHSALLNQTYSRHNKAYKHRPESYVATASGPVPEVTGCSLITASSSIDESEDRSWTAKGFTFLSPQSPWRRQVTSSCEGNKSRNVWRWVLERLEVGAMKTRETKPESRPFLSNQKG